MKILGYEFRKFESHNTTLETVETWVVEWYSLHYDFSDYYRHRSMFKIFIDEKQAKLFKRELEDARKLLGDKYVECKMYKQDSPTNKI